MISNGGCVGGCPSSFVSNQQPNLPAALVFANLALRQALTLSAREVSAHPVGLPPLYLRVGSIPSPV